MTRLTKTLMMAMLAAGLATAPTARAFSLLGQFKNWQVTDLGYQLPFDIGGPQLPTEGYRWNQPTIHYAFDGSFAGYFGNPGMAAVDGAIKIFNDLPRLNLITNDGSFFYIRGEPVPTDVQGPPNFGFAAAGLLDVKSRAMEMLVEELGLAEPARWNWTLRSRNTITLNGVIITNYVVVKLNYDPITLQPSSYVNGQLFDYEIVEPIMAFGFTYADAIEIPADPAGVYAYAAVAGRSAGPGSYYFGLSHDDIGGLKFLYDRNNFAVDQLLGNVTRGTGFNGSPWAAYVGLTNTLTGTNVLGGTNLVITGVRPGLNKITFRKVKYDSLFGSAFIPLTNTYNDLVISNSRPIIQPIQRVLTQPDILFLADDNGLFNNLSPISLLRTATSAWQNNDAINGNDDATGDGFGGPGVIAAPIRISFSNQLPYWSHSSSGFLNGGDEISAPAAIWASFDENTETPVIYPLYLNLTLEDVQRAAR